jgi:hypothetical protein
MRKSKNGPRFFHERALFFNSYPKKLSHCRIAYSFYPQKQEAIKSEKSNPIKSKSYERMKRFLAFLIAFFPVAIFIKTAIKKTKMMFFSY